MDTFVYFVMNLPSAKILILLISNVINLAHFPKNLRILTKVCNVYSKKNRISEQTRTSLRSERALLGTFFKAEGPVRGPNFRGDQLVLFRRG